MLYLTYVRSKAGSTGMGILFLISAVTTVVGGLTIGEQVFWTGCAGTPITLIFG